MFVPPTEYDPETGDELSATTSSRWARPAWSRRGRGSATRASKHPLDRPFAWALVRLDGADTAMLHVVDAGDEARMRTGMRVRARWREERDGDITDIACFEPEEQE